MVGIVEQDTGDSNGAIQLPHIDHVLGIKDVHAMTRINEGHEAGDDQGTLALLGSLDCIHDNIETQRQYCE